MKAVDKLDQKSIAHLLSGPLGVVVVLLVTSSLLLPLLGFCLVFQVSEAREGVVIYEILRSGEFILPLRHGETIPSKPILFHWLGSVFASILPDYNEFALRLPSALAGIASVGVLFALARQCAGVLTGMLAVAFLLSTYVFTHLAVDGRVDMLFFFFFVTAVSIWISRAIRLLENRETLSEMKESTYCAIGIVCGFAVLAKGPLGLVLPVLVVAAIACALTGSFSGMRVVLRPGWLLSIAVGLPWYILATLSGQDSFLARQIIFENLTRFFGGSGILGKPLYFYGVHIWTQFAPWLLIVVIIFLLFRCGTRTIRKFIDGFSFSERALASASFVWLVTIFLFLSLSVGKRRAYLLTASPAFVLLLAVFLGHWMKKLQESDCNTFFSSRSLRRSGYAVLAVVPILALLFYFGTLSRQIPFFSNCPSCEQSIYSLPLAIDRAPKTLTGFFLFFSVGAVYWWRKAFRGKDVVAISLSIFFFLQLVFVVFVPSLLGIKGITHSYRDFAASVSSRIDSQQPITMLLKPGDESFDSFFFYYRQRVGLWDFNKRPDKPGVYLSRRRWLAKTPKSWRENVREIYVGGRKTDSAGELLVLFELTA